MAVVLRASDIEPIIQSLSRKWDQKELQEKALAIVEPLIELNATSVPLFIQDDFKQVQRLNFIEVGLKRVARAYKEDGIRDIVGYLHKFFEVERKHWMTRSFKKEECRFVRIDDIVIEPVIYPKTYYKSKLLAKIRKALMDFYKSRYCKGKHSKRASKFAFAILDGKRPELSSNNLVKFFGGRRDYAQNALSTSLVIIRSLLERHKEEMRWALEE